MKNILFDWSGVVRDTITNQLWIVNRIFKEYNVREISAEDFRENWEQPPRLFYQKYLPKGYSEEERLVLFKKLQLDSACPKSAAFSDVVNLINVCKKRNYFLAVVSSDFSETLLPEVKQYGLENIFDEIVTDVSDKLEPVRTMIQEKKLQLENTFFIGDSNHEIEVAKKAGIKSIAVTWGFTSESELRAKNPDYLVRNVQELQRIVL